MKLGIVITTYQRKDGKTPSLLKRALDSIFNQDYQNFKIFLIGDKYENESELVSLIKNYDQEKFFFENLKFAKERDKYIDNNKNALWSYGGVNAMNYGINKSLENGYEYICHLDHDDFWTTNHLSSLKLGIDKTNSPFICTKSEYVDNRILPDIKSNDEILDYIPRGGHLIHSSVCMNFKEIPLRYRDLFEESGRLFPPGDWDLWNRTAEFLNKNNKRGCLINRITCKHLEEGYERSK